MKKSCSKKTGVFIKCVLVICFISAVSLKVHAQKDGNGYMAQAKVCLLKKDSAACNANVNKAITAFLSKERHRDAAEAYLKTEEYYQAFGGTDMNVRIAWYEKALAQFRKTTAYDRREATLKVLGDFYQVQGKYNQALTYLEEALTLEKYVKPIDKESLYDLLGNMYAFTGNLDKALIYGLLAIKMVEVAKDTTMQACAVYNRVGITYYTIRQFPLSRVFFEKSLAVAAKHHDVQTEINEYVNISQVLISLGRFTDGVKLLKGVIKKYPAAEIDRQIGVDLRLLICYIHLKQFDAAKTSAGRLESISHQPELVLLDIHLKGTLTGIDLARQLNEENIAFVYLSANSNQKILEEAKATNPYGFMVKPFREKDVLISLEIAQYLHEQNAGARRNSELMLQSTLTDILADGTSWDNKLLKIAKSLQAHIPFDYLAIGMKNMDIVPYRGAGFLRLGFNDYQVIGFDELLTIAGIKKHELTKAQEPTPEDEETTFYNDGDFKAICQRNIEKSLIARTFKMAANLTVFVPANDYKGFTLSFYSRKSDTYLNRHLALIKRMRKILAAAIDGILITAKPAAGLQVEQIAASPKKLHKPVEKAGFNGIIGSSHLLLTALDHLALVAPMETSVLILGESGTGKERFARSIQSLSPRSNKPMVVVNCAALPAHLIESELFGHEKGAFTGATDRRIGKFEQAHTGTIFLDEIGELPLESQAKLLRVLQEREIERLGGRETIKVDVRIIAATNCNLEKEVAAGKFRLDLYYRLNIFPIILPSLRERKEDLPELADFFVKRYSERAGKAGMLLAPQALNDLAMYDWPGNVRELEHLIERNVLLTRGMVIERIALPHQANVTETVTKTDLVKSIDDNERDHILSVLKKCGGRISGPGGAAELLNVPSTTLNSKMKRLGITRQHVTSFNSIS